MMKSFPVLFLVIMITIVPLSLCDKANAAGFGIGGVYGTGTTELDLGYIEDFDADATHIGASFLIDTAVATDRLFNYRIAFSFESLEYDDLELGGTRYSNSFDFDRISTDHTFGFGVVRNRTMRFYFGPQIRLAYIIGDQADAAGFGIAPVLGFNFHLARNMSLSTELLYRYSFYYDTSTSLDYYDYDTFESSEKEFCLGISLFFRNSSDSY